MQFSDVTSLNNHVSSHWAKVKSERCQLCITKLSRPQSRLRRDQSICNACRSRLYKQSIDWDQRRLQFLDLFNYTRKINSAYDVLIPVSGGKDSHWQISVALELDLKPLCVTYAPAIPTLIGKRNLDLVSCRNLDHLILYSNLGTDRLISLEGLRDFGSPCIPLHLKIFHSSRRLATFYRIPLVLWGENCALEYGSNNPSLASGSYCKDWFDNFGNTFGTDSIFWEARLGLPSGSLIAYSDAEANKNVISEFFGNYFYWTPANSLKSALSIGFQISETPLIGHYNYADLDDRLMVLHHYMKYVKFGVSRVEDNLSIEIREGNITRASALSLYEKAAFPELTTSDVSEFCTYLGISQQELFSMILAYLPDA